MTLVHDLRFAGCNQALSRVLANRFQQPVSLGTVAGLVGLHERFAHEVCQQVKYVFRCDPLARADHFRSFQAPAPGKDRKPVEQEPFRLRQQVVTPIESRPQRLLAW